MSNGKIKKVIATVEERLEPEYYAHYECQYCNDRKTYDLCEENYTITEKCDKCGKKFKVKVPKY